MKGSKLVAMSDEAEDLSGVLDRLLEKGHVGTKGQKAARIHRNREKLVALHTQGWSWDRLAQALGEAGFKVSARTLRVETLAAAAKTKKKQPKATPHAARKPERKPAVAPPEVVVEVPSVEKAKPHGTESHFYKIDEKEIF
jgi:uncharacterized lipoprotein